MTSKIKSAFFTLLADKCSLYDRSNQWTHSRNEMVNFQVLKGKVLCVMVVVCVSVPKGSWLNMCSPAHRYWEMVEALRDEAWWEFF
jgi:hypothetical protein